MNLVPITEIPRNSVNIPKENLSKVYNICQQMQDLCEKENGIGLSAVQVGLNLKLFIVKNSDSSYDYFADCEYIPQGNTFDSIEGCLSLKNIDGSLRRFLVKRWDKIQVKGKKFKKDELELEDFSVVLKKDSIVFQHEIDHQNGILISEIGKEISLW